MARPEPFIDSETGLKRQREQRPDGAEKRFRIENFLGWEIYHCVFPDCVYDTQYSDQFDSHYHYRHEVPLAQARELQDAERRARERAERMKPGR